MNASMRIQLGIIPMVLLLSVVACGGGGGGTSPGATANQSAPGEANGTAVITIPNRTASSVLLRSAQYVSPSAVSIGLAVNGGNATYSDISPTSTLCTVSTLGRTCTIPVLATPGSDTFALTLYDGANGTGKTLGIASLSQTITQGTPFTLAFTAAGVVAALDVSVPVIDVGPTSVPVTVSAKDADGQTIIGAGPYASPITLTNSDTSGALQLSATTIAAPGAQVMLAYTGATVTSAATISATASGIASSAVSPASVMPYNYFPAGISANYAASITSSDVPYVDGAMQTAGAPSASTGTSTRTITAGASLNGLTGLQEIVDVNNNDYFGSAFSFANAYANVANGVYGFAGYALPTVTTVLPGACSLGPPYGNTGVTYAESFTITLPQPMPYALLPFAAAFALSSGDAYTQSGTTTTSPGPSNAFLCGSYSPPAAFTDTSTMTRSTSGAFSDVESYTDGSSYTLQDNTDGSGSISYTAGQTLPANAVAWENGLAYGTTAAAETISAPSGGTITVTVKQTAGGVTQTQSATVPVTSVYPTGLPSALFSNTSTTGAPVTALPAACAATAPYSGPVVPVTTVLKQWSPSVASVDVETVVDYLAPSRGVLCETQSDSLATALSSTLPTLAFPLQLTPLSVDVNVYNETDSMTSFTGSSGITSATRLQSQPAPYRRRFLDAVRPPRAGAIARR